MGIYYELKFHQISYLLYFFGHCGGQGFSKSKKLINFQYEVQILEVD